MTPGEWQEVDPFDLPDWLGVDPVTWSADEGLTGSLVRGRLRGGGDAPGAAGDPGDPGDAGDPGRELACDLLAADQAYPRPAVDEETRTRVHQAWRHGQVHLVERAGRLTIALPGTDLTADRVLTALGRLAQALGARPERYAAHLRVARER